MRKVLLNVAMSLDGLIEGPNGEFDWCFTDDDYGMTPFLERVDAIFYGRKSYEVLMREGKGQNPFKDKRSYVFSKTLGRSDNYTLISDRLVESVQEIKQKEGADIWLFGGTNLTKQLVENKLVDELFLAVHPLILGSGKPMFDLAGRVSLKLLDTKPYKSGLVSMHYQIV